MDRQQHLEWCKKRAHEYLARGDVQNAVASMMSDMQKHPETAVAFKPGNPLGMLGLMAAVSGDVREATRYIDGFN